MQLSPRWQAPRRLPADLVVSDAKIYTQDAHHSIAEALAVRGGKIIFVGSATDAQRLVGPQTRLEKLGGRLVLPGLVDSHIHPLDIVDLDVCNLESKPMPLKELSAFVARCLAHYKTAPGQRLIVHQWNYTDGNQPDPGHPTLRAALDAASTTVQIQLLGNDWHHGAFNSLALAQAKNPAGKVLGLSKQTLATDFKEYRPFVGVDADGEPNGAVNEDARYLINPNSMLDVNLDLLAQAPERVTQKLNGVGITAFLDAMVPPVGARGLRQALRWRTHDGAGAARAVLRSVAHAQRRWAGGLRLDPRQGARHAGEICAQSADPRRFHQDLRRRRARG